MQIVHTKWSTTICTCVGYSPYVWCYLVTYLTSIKKGRKKLGKGAQVGGKGGPSPLHPPNGDAFGPPLPECYLVQAPTSRGVQVSEVVGCVDGVCGRVWTADVSTVELRASRFKPFITKFVLCGIK